MQLIPGGPSLHSDAPLWAWPSSQALLLGKLTTRLCLWEFSETSELTAASLAQITPLSFPLCCTAQSVCPEVAAPPPGHTPAQSHLPLISKLQAASISCCPSARLSLLLPPQTCSFLFRPHSGFLLEEGKGGEDKEGHLLTYLLSPGGLFCLWPDSSLLNPEVKILASLFFDMFQTIFKPLHRESLASIGLYDIPIHIKYFSMFQILDILKCLILFLKMACVFFSLPHSPKCSHSYAPCVHRSSIPSCLGMESTGRPSMRNEQDA